MGLCLPCLYREETIRNLLVVSLIYQKSPSSQVVTYLLMLSEMVSSYGKWRQVVNLDKT